MTSHQPRLSPLVLCSALFLGACQGEDNAAPGGDESSDNPAELSERVPDPSPLSRLTTQQYLNTVVDLFPDVELPQLLFPPQLEAAGGFENNATFNSPTGPLVDAYNRAAIAVAEGVEFGNIGCDLEDAGCPHGYIEQLAERAWRRPLEAAELEQLHADYDSWAGSYGSDDAMRLTIQSLLQSPDFLYFPRFGAAMPDPDSDGAAVALSSWEMASRLSYFLWNTMPDDELFELAREDQLRDRDVLVAQTWRMLADQRARQAVVNLHRQLFDFDDLGAIDLEFYADKTNEGDSDFYYLFYLPQVRHEPDVFVQQHIFEGDGTLASLLTSNKAWVTYDTARIAYDTPIPLGAPSVRYTPADRSLIGLDELEGGMTYYEVELDPNQRAGLFTLASFLSSKANPRDPSPVKRGVLLLERLQCTHLVPPGDVPPLEDVEMQMPKTNREKYALHTAVPACQGCHESIDGIGFTFENYDSLGAWRDTDNGYPVDATGALHGTDVDAPVQDAVELMGLMAQSRTIHDCYVRQLFRHAFGRNEDITVDEPTLEFLQEGFWQSGGDIPELLVNIAASYQFRYREVAQP